MHCSNVDGAGSNRSDFGVCVGGESEELLLMASDDRATLPPCQPTTPNSQRRGRKGATKVAATTKVAISKHMC